MKIKTDFVTNSSSSSFIVAWPWEIKTIGDVEEFIPERYAETVFNDARRYKTFRANDPKAAGLMSKKIKGGYLLETDVPTFTDFLHMFCKREGVSENELQNNPVWRSQAWQEREVIVDISGKNYARKFIKELTNEHFIYIFNYGDEDGSFFSEMEHNNIFEKLKHIWISHH